MSYKKLYQLYTNNEYYNSDIENKSYNGPLYFENNPNIATAVDKGFSNPNLTLNIGKSCKGNLDHHLKIDGVT